MTEKVSCNEKILQMTKVLGNKISSMVLPILQEIFLVANYKAHYAIRVSQKTRPSITRRYFTVSKLVIQVRVLVAMTEAERSEDAMLAEGHSPLIQRT